MSDNKQHIWAAISSVMNGNPSSEEQKLVESWMKENELNKKFFELIKHSSDEKVVLSPEARERIFSKVETNVLPTKKSRRIILKPLTVAASIAAIVSFIVISLVINMRQKGQMVYLESKTPFGVTTKLVLPDSTFVYLNAGSSLKYPAKFKEKNREVYLNGEAYFEVEKDTKHPFIVNTSHIDIKVLGTHFNIKSYPENNIFETTLIEGSVALHKHSEDKTEIARLKPNQKAIYNSKTNKISLQKVNAELVASWKDNKFYFDNETLSSIIIDLKRNYNVPIRICSPEISNDKYSGFFDKNRTIYQALDIMKFNRNFYYQTRNDTILIYSKDL